MKKEIFQISPHENGCPLVDVLAAHLNCSKRRAKALLDARTVHLNRKRIWMAQHPVRTKDIIEVTVPEGHMDTRAQEIEILWKDAEWLVVNKPAGIVTNKSPQSLEARLQEQLRSSTVRAVHRLDRDTSGCVIFARNEAARKKMIDLFRDQQIVKIYRALVIGKFPGHIKTIHNDIDGQSASTEVLRLDARKSASYLELRIRTGRTHQIRKHLKFVRHTVAGDKSYRNENALDDRLRALPRQMLHAYRLIFTHPGTGKTVRVTAPVPADFKDALNAFHLK